MASNSKNRAGQIIATSMIGLVCIGFMFTGYETYNNSGADTVAKVGDTVNIKFIADESFDRAASMDQLLDSRVVARDLGKPESELDANPEASSEAGKS